MVYLEHVFVAGCLCSYTTSRHFIRDPAVHLGIWESLVSQSEFMLQGGLCLTLSHRCCGAMVHWSLPVAAGVCQSTFYNFLTIYTTCKSFFILFLTKFKLPGTLMSEGDANMHGKNWRFISKHFYLSN